MAEDRWQKTEKENGCLLSTDLWERLSSRDITPLTIETTL
jgi:hypothetical protein